MRQREEAQGRSLGAAWQLGEQHFRRLLEKLPAGAYTCDADGLITYYNQRALELWGRSPKLKDPMDRYCGSFKLFTSDGRPIDHADGWMALALRKNEEFNDLEIVIERPDGTRRTALAYANPIHDETGRILGAVNVLVDISERRRVEEEIRHVNQTLRTLIQSSPLPIVVVDSDAPIVRLWNPAAERLFGWLESEVVGRPIPIVPASEQAECLISRTAVAAGETLSGAPTCRLKKDGSLVAVSLSAAPLRDAVGNVSGVLLLFADMTERKRAEDALREADRRKDEFLATLAHELRNPLAPIRNALQIMRLKSPSSELEWAMGVIDRQMKQMTRLVDDLLDVARIAGGKLELRRERIELAEVLRSAAETSRPLIDASGQEFSVAIPAEPIYVEGDLTRLAQVVSNLLNNAAKYTDRGGRIWLAAERQGSDAVISVRDTGVGIPAEMLPRVFEMFTQVDRALDRAQGGLGIGLALVKRLVDMHGGSISARSDGPGCGSEMIVRLPVLIEARAAHDHIDHEGVTAAAAPRRILVVDDNEDTVASLGVLLQMLGYEVHTAYDGAQAVHLAEQLRPDVVLLDIGLPKMNGYEAARWIRRRPWGKAMVLIATTGWGQDSDREHSQKAGFDHHMVKPIDPGKLIELLAESKRTDPVGGKGRQAASPRRSATR